MKTPMQELLEYIKTAHTFTFLPEQLAKTIEEKYLPMEKLNIIETFSEGELNVWNQKRDESFEYEGGINYFEKTYINN
jgi:hypothetical protein